MDHRLRAFTLLIAVLAMAGPGTAPRDLGTTASSPKPPQRLLDSRAIAEEPLHHRLFITQRFSGLISEEARALLTAVVASEVGDGYCMIKSDSPRRETQEVKQLKLLEAKVRGHLTWLLSLEPGVSLAYLCYGEHILFVERRFPTDAEREQWRATSGGDTYIGPFRGWVYGSEADGALVDVVSIDNDTLIGVPVLSDGRYVCGLYLRFVQQPTAPAWPVIKPLRETISFVDHQTTEARITLVGTDGSPLYLLECYLNASDRDDDPNFDYSGDFEVRMTSLYSKEPYSTLLTDRQFATADWQSHGRFFIDQLTGEAAEDPECGRVRQIRLRGMHLTLEVKSFEVGIGSSTPNVCTTREPVRLKRLKFEFTAVPDPTATAEIDVPEKNIATPEEEEQWWNRFRECPPKNRQGPAS